MAPDVTKEFDVVEGGQPLGVVGHDGVTTASAEVDEAREGAFDALLVGLDLLQGQELAALVPPGGIADPRRASAHQRDRLAAGLLQPMEHHDREEMADVERGRRAIVAHIGHELARQGLRVEPLRIGALMNEAPLREHLQEIRSWRAHRLLLSAS